MSYNTISLVLTLVTDNEKSYNHKRKKIQEIFTKYKIELINSKKLTKNVIDYSFEASKSNYLKIKDEIAIINVANEIIFLQKSKTRRKKIIVETKAYKAA